LLDLKKVHILNEETFQYEQEWKSVVICRHLRFYIEKVVSENKF